MIANRRGGRWAGRGRWEGRILSRERTHGLKQKKPRGANLAASGAFGGPPRFADSRDTLIMAQKGTVSKGGCGRAPPTGSPDDDAGISSPDRRFLFHRLNTSRDEGVVSSLGCQET